MFIGRCLATVPCLFRTLGKYATIHNRYLSSLPSILSVWSLLVDHESDTFGRPIAFTTLIYEYFRLRIPHGEELLLSLTLMA